MAVYQSGSTSDIGTLLRLIKEEKTQAPPMPPASDVGSPIRELVQEPLKSPESPDSSRVVSIKPEAPVGSAPVVSPSGVAGSPVVPATSPQVIAPIRPLPQVSAPSGGGGGGSPAPSPSAPAPAPIARSAPVPTQGVKGASIGPQAIMPSYVLDLINKLFNTPLRSVGFQHYAEKPIPSPTPIPRNPNQQQLQRDIQKTKYSPYVGHTG